ncbi:tetrahydrofolate synthase [Acididesulfobacillus acetoxydans]|uniref:Lipid II isoglutaminyl synthase (glutamine-hydrolyzing) subunit MurT n=1 Tax=Acididesulfobacillus acetoxydans TaxID=1561005 RepID=A0A8S0VWB9_9FIRM|nr:Mur ligase family protein [Acididesulfobacillus acetoxydans]CAA7600693.1 tetrahydrofolate synthase [Acididesulfobacillus acetoxydans]CEJ09474.1 UDP-N-acetylmuramyl tripeptide synthase [Acididesulfobacillus acetoxydans]
MKRTWRFYAAVWAGKLSGALLKLLGRTGTTLPGAVAQRLDPACIAHLGASLPEGVLLVTGTNGKTTTANLLANILRAAGKDFAFNQAGANLVTGITGALLQDTGWSGRLRVPLALLEVDEATVPKVCAQITPRLAIITNFFRDQLDRYGELDTTVRLVRNALPRATALVLNADDPLVAQFGIGRSDKRAADPSGVMHQGVIYYGVERIPESSAVSGETREARFCPLCGAPLEYTLFHYGQLGLFACPSCSFRRPLPHLQAQQVRMEEGKLYFRVGVNAYEVALQGYYNLYNALAAVAAAVQLDIDGEAIARGLREFVPQAGRMERFLLLEGEVTLALVKNPTGFNQVIHTVLNGGAAGIRLLIAINDLAADGRDVSWLWDVDFERLGAAAEAGEGRVDLVVCTGLRAEDMALRLKYAGVPEDRLRIEHSAEKALALVSAGRGGREAVYVLPTYTMLFPLRTLLEAAAAHTGRGLSAEGRASA